MANLILYASGTKNGGASGAREILGSTKVSPRLFEHKIVAIVSNHEFGGARILSDCFDIPFVHFTDKDCKPESYQAISERFKADFHVLTGWLWKVRGLETKRVINKHPGPWPHTRGSHGDDVHKKVMELYRAGVVKQSEIIWHYAPDFDLEINGLSGYDIGPIIFRFPVPIHKDYTWEVLRASINEKERTLEPTILNWILSGSVELCDNNTVAWRYIDLGKLFGR